MAPARGQPAPCGFAGAFKGPPGDCEVGWSRGGIRWNRDGIDGTPSSTPFSARLLTIRWTPGRAGIEGNETADEWARMAAESELNVNDMEIREYLHGTSFAHMARMATPGPGQ